MAHNHIKELDITVLQNYNLMSFFQFPAKIQIVLGSTTIPKNTTNFGKRCAPTCRWKCYHKSIVETCLVGKAWLTKSFILFSERNYCLVVEQKCLNLERIWLLCFSFLAARRWDFFEICGKFLACLLQSLSNMCWDFSEGRYNSGLIL